MRDMNYNQLNGMSIEELKNLNRLVIEVIKSKQSMMAYQMKHSLKVGDNVRIKHPKINPTEAFIVRNIKQKNASVVSISGRHSYNVAMSLLEVIG